MMSRSKRIFSPLIGLFLTLLLLALGGCSLLSPAAAPISGTITISGSTALLPFAQRAAQDFQKLHPKVTLDVQGGGSFTGLDQMFQGKVDTGDSDVYADPTRYPDPDITDHLVAVVPFAMVVNLDVTLTSLSHAQIVSIYTGQITNWRAVGGPNEPIKIIARPLSSGTRATFQKYMLNGADETPGAIALTKDSSQDLVAAVSQTPGAIAYLAVSAVIPQVRIVAIDSVLPTPENIEQGRYTFWSYEHMYTRGLPQGGVAAFLDFLLTPQEQRVAATLGYIPVSAMHTG